jgi:hypothetical protein
LNLSRHWRIHFVISVAQLKSVSDSIKDSYNRSRSNESESIHMKDDTEKVKSFEIERLINKRNIARGVEYLLRWKGYDPQWDEWRSLDELYNALDLVQDYEKSMDNITTLSDRLPRINLITDTFNSSPLDGHTNKNPPTTKRNPLKAKTFEPSHTTSIRRSSRKRKPRGRG